MLTLPLMGDGWLDRLQAAIKADGRAPRAISLAARLGPNYLSEMLSKGKVPSVDKLLKLCAELNVSPSYIIANVQVTPDTEELLGILGGLSEDDLSQLLYMARRLASSSQR